MKTMMLSIFQKAFAFGVNVIGNPSVPSGYIKSNEGAERISSALSVIFVLTAITAVFTIMWAGFAYITSTGDPGKIKQAMSTLQWAVVGLIISGLGYLIVSIIAGIMGINSLELPF